MTFSNRVKTLMFSIFLTIMVLLGITIGFSYYLMGKVESSYVQGEKLSQTLNLARQAQVSLQRQVQEWKDVLLRGHDKEMRIKYFSSFENMEATMDQQLGELSKILREQHLDDIAKKSDQIIVEHELLGQKYRTALQSQSDLTWQGQQSIDTLVKGADRITSEKMDSLANEIDAEVKYTFKNQLATAKAEMIRNLVILGLLTLLVTAFLIYLLAKMIRDLIQLLGDQPERVVASTMRIAQGDLTEKLNAKSPNSLIGSLEMMQMRLRNISLAIIASADELKSQTYSLSNNQERSQILNELKKVYEAISRIKTDRTH